MAWVEKDRNAHPVPTPCYMQGRVNVVSDDILEGSFAWRTTRPVQYITLHDCRDEDQL